jgi:hypothetical protein
MIESHTIQLTIYMMIFWYMNSCPHVWVQAPLKKLYTEMYMWYIKLVLSKLAELILFFFNITSWDQTQLFFQTA